VRYGNTVEAFLAMPDVADKHPSVILLPERYGQVQHTLDLAAAVGVPRPHLARRLPGRPGAVVVRERRSD
jgi:hypothetical protein